jgi:hypothetical protein
VTPNRARGGVALRLGGAALAVAAVNGLDLPLTVRRLRALAGGEPVLDLRLAYSAEDVRRVLSRLGPAGRSEYLTMLWTVDLVLPALFATALGAAIRAGALARWHRVALAAAGVDYLENAALSGLIAAHPAVHPGLAALASLLTIAKFSLYLTALLVALAGALRSRADAVHRRTRQGRPIP